MGWPRSSHSPGMLERETTSGIPQGPRRPTQSPWRKGSLLRVGPDEKPQGGEVSFGGGIVNRQGACVCGQGGVPTAMTQQPVHHLWVAKAGSQMQDCGTRIVSVLWEETSLVPSLVLPASLAQTTSGIPPATKATLSSGA